MQLLIFVSFDLHNTSSGHYAYESDTGIIGCYHGYIVVEKVNARNFATTWELAVIVSHLNGSLQLQFLETLCLLDHHLVLGYAHNVRPIFVDLRHRSYSAPMKVCGRKLDAVIVDQTDAVNQTHYELVALFVDLHRRNIVWGLLPIDDFPLINIPNPNHFVETTGCHVVLGSGSHEKGWA